MKMINWNTEAFEKECVNVSMDRLEAAAKIIRDDAKQILRSKIKGPPITRHGQKEVWMERDPGALIDTIRVARKKGDPSRDVWIIAGNYKTWWALQTEYGRGGWKGGAKSFLRPAMAKASIAIKTALEGGSGQTKDFPGYK
jgi:hypothetical protein